jgi:hypothetical protein
MFINMIYFHIKLIHRGVNFLLLNKIQKIGQNSSVNSEGITVTRNISNYRNQNSSLLIQHPPCYTTLTRQEILVPNILNILFQLMPLPASAFEGDFSGILIPYSSIQHAKPLFFTSMEEKASGCGLFLSVS